MYTGNILNKHQLLLVFNLSVVNHPFLFMTKLYFKKPPELTLF